MASLRDQGDGACGSRGAAATWWRKRAGFWEAKRPRALAVPLDRAAAGLAMSDLARGRRIFWRKEAPESEAVSQEWVIARTARALERWLGGSWGGS